MSAFAQPKPRLRFRRAGGLGAVKTRLEVPPFGTIQNRMNKSGKMEDSVFVSTPAFRAGAWVPYTHTIAQRMRTHPKEFGINPNMPQVVLPDAPPILLTRLNTVPKKLIAAAAAQGTALPTGQVATTSINDGVAVNFGSVTATLGAPKIAANMPRVVQLPPVAVSPTSAVATGAVPLPSAIAARVNGPSMVPAPAAHPPPPDVQEPATVPDDSELAVFGDAPQATPSEPVYGEAGYVNTMPDYQSEPDYTYPSGPSSIFGDPSTWPDPYEDTGYESVAPYESDALGGYTGYTSEVVTGDVIDYATGEVLASDPSGYGEYSGYDDSYGLQGFGSILGNVFKTVLPAVTSLIPGVGQIVAPLVSSITSKATAPTSLALPQSSSEPPVLNQVLQALPGVISAIVNKPKAETPAPVVRPAISTGTLALGGTGVLVLGGIALLLLMNRRRR